MKIVRDDPSGVRLRTSFCRADIASAQDSLVKDYVPCISRMQFVKHGAFQACDVMRSRNSSRRSQIARSIGD